MVDRQATIAACERLIFREPEHWRAYRAALFLLFSGHDMEIVQNVVRWRDEIAEMTGRQIREAGLTQVEVARRAGVDQSKVSLFLRGYKVRHTTKLKIHDAVQEMVAATNQAG